MPRRGRGGRRTPQTPAQHSGQGASSSRTDGQPLATRDSGPTAGGGAPDPPAFPASRYGGRQTTQQMQQGGSPAGQQGSAPGGRGGGQGAGQPTGPGTPGGGSNPSTRDPFNTPTERPDETSFAGLNRQQSGPSAADITQRIDMATVAPALPILESLAQRSGSSATLRNTVRRLRAQVPSGFSFDDVLPAIRDAAGEGPEEGGPQGAAPGPGPRTSAEPPE